MYFCSLIWSVSIEFEFEAMYVCKIGVEVAREPWKTNQTNLYWFFMLIVSISMLEWS